MLSLGYWWRLLLNYYILINYLLLPLAVKVVLMCVRMRHLSCGGSSGECCILRTPSPVVSSTRWLTTTALSILSTMTSPRNLVSLTSLTKLGSFANWKVREFTACRYCASCFRDCTKHTGAGPYLRPCPRLQSYNLRKWPLKLKSNILETRNLGYNIASLLIWLTRWLCSV